MSITIHKYKKKVSPNTNDALDLVIPDGEVWDILNFSGFPNDSRDSHIELVWDMDGGSEDVIEVTHGTIPNKNVNESKTGDGVKKLSICLVNNTPDEETLGAEITVKVL